MSNSIYPSPAMETAVSAIAAELCAMSDAGKIDGWDSWDDSALTQTGVARDFTAKYTANGLRTQITVHYSQDRVFVGLLRWRLPDDDNDRFQVSFSDDTPPTIIQATVKAMF